MGKIDVTRRQLGIHMDTCKATIKIWAPLAESIALAINDGSNLSLQKQEYGYWVGESDALKTGDTYKILIDGQTERPDPASLCQPEGVHGASGVVDLTAYHWTDADWQNHALEDYLFYELHTGTFTPEGTFDAIAGKLDHLVALGITAIELMPVAQFPGERNWGYDGVYPFAVQHSYGGPQGLMALVDACHARGIAVVLDVVYNHLGPEGNYFGDFGPYFTQKYTTPWGNALNVDDAWCDGVRQYVIENVLMWFRDYHIDALRLDAVHAIKDFSTKHILSEIKGYVNELMRVTGRTHYLITELDLNDPRFIEPRERQGYGMDAQWTDEFHHALRVTAGGETTGYYADFNGIEHLAKAYTDAYVYDGMYSPHRQKTFGAKTAAPGKRFVVFSQNHDQVGNRMLGERTSVLHSFEMQKLLAGAVLLSPYLPMLFMGEEWGETHPFQYFVSHTDPELVEAVRNGRKAEFIAFQQQGEAPDPQSDDTFQRSKLQWHLPAEGRSKQLLAYYKALIRLRKEHAALRRLNRKQVNVQVDKVNQVLLLHRWHQTEHVLCLLNFSGAVANFGLPADYAWKVLFNSADERWGGTVPVALPGQPLNEVTIQPESFIIYCNDYV